MTESHGPSAEHVSLLSRACENCRARKTRCNKRIPCFNCQALGVQCRPASRTEHRPRIVVSSQYEKQVELIQERLHAVERGVNDLLRNSRRQDRLTPLTPTANHESPGELTPYEGESSFSNETLQASRAVSDVLRKNADHAAISALSSFQDSLSTIQSSRQAYDAYLGHKTRRCRSPDVSLLPAALVIALVNRIKETPPLCAVASSWTDYAQLELLCQKIYFPVDAIPSGAMALVHGMLYSIIRDYAQQNDPKLAEYGLEDCAHICERNFQTCLERYESLITPTLENIQALWLAASMAQYESKLSLCRTYVSIAQNMCQTLGYHRESSYRTDLPQVARSKRLVFYGLYTIDKNLSLVLGRSSNFNDNDIDTEPPALSTNPKQQAWDFYNHLTFRFAKIQGEVYDKLYSACATNLSQKERSYFVEHLSSQVTKLQEELQSLDVSNAYFSEELQMVIQSVDFVIYAVLTVIYRGETCPANSIEISSRCYNAAKLSLESHLKCFATFETRNTHQQMDYVKSTLLYPSFTPYVIVFTSAIAAASHEDLVLLRETVGSLANLQSFSPGAQRLYNACKSFLDTAEVLIRSQRNVNGLEHHDDGSLVFRASVVPDPDRQMADRRCSISFGDLHAGSVVNTSAPIVSVGASDDRAIDMDVLNLWSNWMESSKSITDMIHFDFTDIDVGNAFGAGS